MNEHNKKLKSRLNEKLEKERMDIDGILIPLLGKQTKQIVLDCNDGKISDVTPFFRTG